MNPEEQSVSESRKLKNYDEAFNNAVKEVEDFIEVPIKVNVLIGQKRIKIRDLLDFTSGTLVVLDRSAGESLQIYLENTYFAKGEVTIMEDTFAVRITEINDPRKV